MVILTPTQDFVDSLIAIAEDFPEDALVVRQKSFRTMPNNLLRHCRALRTNQHMSLRGAAGDEAISAEKAKIASLRSQ